MNILWILASLLIGYLCGSVSFSRLITALVAPGKSLDNQTVTTSKGNEWKMEGVGASTIGNVLGTRWGVITGLLDILKAFIPTLILKLVFPEQPYYLFCAAAAVAGHNWPVWHGFRGGWGISPLYGGALAVHPLGAVVSAVAGNLIGLFVVRDFLTAYLSGLWLMIPIFWLWGGDWHKAVYALAVNIIFILRMIPEFKNAAAKKNQSSTDLDEAMEVTPMGRSMKKMADKMGWKINRGSSSQKQ